MIAFGRECIGTQWNAAPPGGKKKEKVERKKVEAKIEKGFTEEELGQFNDLDIMDDSSKMYILNDMYTGQGYVLKVRGYLIYEGMEEYEESKVIIE